MRILETTINGCFVVELETIEDDRGFFARLYCHREFRDHGMDPSIAQINCGYSIEVGTLRGMHYQREPASDTKLVKCIQGAVFDVCLDLRPDSDTFCKWVGVELSAQNRKMLFLPAGTAHGYQTLTPASEILYATNCPYSPADATGVRYNDTAFKIDWPLAVSQISEADRAWPDFSV
jgi:dTDP-4-dehydrorhamnose 3,5-epimerase